MKTDAEIIAYLTKNFSNTEVFDTLIKEWENDCKKRKL